MKTSIMKLLAALVIFAVPAVAHVNYGSFEDFNYTTIVYGDYINHPDGDHGFVVKHNSPAYGLAGGSGDPIVWTYSPQLQGNTLREVVNIDIWNETKAAAIVLGSFKPTKYADGTQMFLNMSVTPSLYPLLDVDLPKYENFYFKLYNNNNGLITELNANKMVDTAYVTAGERLHFEMYALVDQTYANSETWRIYDFRATQGGPAPVPVPGAMLLGSLGIGAVGILRKRLQRA